MSDAFNQSLPADLAALLSNPRIVIPGESEVLEMIAEWTLAPSETPSAPTEADTELRAAEPQPSEERPVAPPLEA